MQVCTSLQTDNHASTPPLSFLQAGCPSCRPTNSVRALKAYVALHCKQNPKAFLKYINSKRKTKTGIGDLQIVDISGNSTTVSSNKDKAEELGKFFSSVFTVEQEQTSPLSD